MFDTNIFNHIVERKITLKEVEDIKYFVTHTQKDELNATPDQEKKEQLLKLFEELEGIQIPTESSLWDVSVWDEAKWDGDGKLVTILKKLEEKKLNHPGNPVDALIGVTVIEKGITLVSDDGDLREIVKELNGKAISLDDFLMET